jgi:DNA-binding NarL/FixJ family response regulator
MITVFLISEHPSMRAVLRVRLELEADITVVGDAQNGTVAATVIAAMSPEVVILDGTLPIRDADSAAALLGRIAVRSAVIMLSLYDDPMTRAYATSAGASAVVSKHGTDAQLLTAIRSGAPSLTPPPKVGASHPPFARR